MLGSITKLLGWGRLRFLLSKLPKYVVIADQPYVSSHVHSMGLMHVIAGHSSSCYHFITCSPPFAALHFQTSRIADGYVTIGRKRALWIRTVFLWNCGTCHQQIATHAGQEIEMLLRYNRPTSCYIIRTLISLQECQRSSWEMRPEERYSGQGIFLERQDSSRMLSRMSQLPRLLLSSSFRIYFIRPCIVLV